MSEWWQVGYPGGKMVDLPGFPRQLYPPDAKGHETSSDGPDVTAYKRAVSRLGRWKWTSFDDTFSNGFSHGKEGGNVGESGIAGVQRQQKIQATGYVGKTTFNMLRSARIPEGLPHAGECAIDAVAQDLLVEAWYMFEGAPEPADDYTAAHDRLQQARFYIGVTESPANSNRTEFGEWYGMDGQPWCAMFVAYCDQHGEHKSPSFARGQRYSYVPYLVNDAEDHNYGLAVTTNPKPGDIVAYDWDGSVYDHVGIFEGWTGGASQFTAIEGNTSIDSDSDGGQVMRRTRTAGPGVMFIRASEP